MKTLPWRCGITLLVVIAWLPLTSCHELAIQRDTGPAGKTNPSARMVSPTGGALPSGTAPAPDTPEKQLQSAFAQTFIRCGDDLFVRVTDMLGLSTGKSKIYHFKAPQIVVSFQPLSQADRLNGYEWQGQVHIQTKAVRQWLDRWSAWWDPTPSSKQPAGPMTQIPMFFASKQRGKVHTSLGAGLVFEQPLPCNKIPRG